MSGVKESTISTINERKCRIYNVINETIAIVQDSRLNKLGGLRCAKEIWELAILPSLLNSAETWPIQDAKIQKSLEDFQSSLYRGLMAVPKSCPLPSLTYESNSWLMKYRVYSRVLNFVKHIHCHNEETNLSKQILSEQILKEWPGLAQQAKSICEELEISGLFDPMVNKKQFKLIVKKVCKQRNDDELKAQIYTYKKMSALKDEVRKGNEYFFNETLKNARTIFRFRVGLFESKMNFKNKPEYKAEKFLCDSCESEVDHCTHVLFCPSYANLRADKDMNSDTDLAQYLQRVLDIRTNLRLNR